MVLNKVSECYSGGGRALHPWQLQFLIIHRLSLSQMAPGNPNPVPDLKLSAKDVSEAFKHRELGTGGCTPYHILIRQNGDVEQMLPLTVKGVHARNYNWRSIAIAIAGNTDERPATVEQHHSALKVCRVLAPVNGWLRIAGHTDLPGASGDPNKRCPGRYFSTDRLSDQIDRDIARGDHWCDVERAGFVI